MATDPFNIVKDELKKSINKTKSLIESYDAVSKAVNSQSPDSSDTSAGKLLAEIRTNLKSINWDVQDLEETIKIASKNPARFNITKSEIDNRNQFISQTKQFIQTTKKTYGIELDDKAAASSASGQSMMKKQANSSNINIRIPDLISNTESLNAEADSENEIFSRKMPNNSKKTDNNAEYQSLQMQHEDIFKEQDRNLNLISSRVTNLKNISHTMQNELDDQANLLDDLGREMDTADSRMQNVMKRITKVLHLSSDKRQWTLIGVLVLAILVILILFAIL